MGLELENCPGNACHCYSLKIVFTVFVVCCILFEIDFVTKILNKINLTDKQKKKQLVVPAANIVIFITYFFVLTLTEEDSTLGVTLEHLAYNYFQFAAALKLQVFFGEMHLLGGDVLKEINFSFIVVTISAIIAPILFTRDDEVDVFDVSVKIYRYIWLLTTAIMDLLLVHLSLKITTNYFVKAVAVCKLLTYLFAVPVLFAFWTQTEILYCISAFPMRLVSISSAMSNFSSFLASAIHKRFFEPNGGSGAGNDSTSRQQSVTKAAAPSAYEKARLKKQEQAAAANKVAPAPAVESKEAEKTTDESPISNAEQQA